jgi:hypothetical protein
MTPESKKILFICGSMNQTTQMHQIAAELPDHDAYFTPYYADGLLEVFRRAGILEFSILGQNHRNRCLTYLWEHSLNIDLHGKGRTYDLVVTCSDLIVPKNVRSTPLVLVQEGMTDPETFLYHLVRSFRFLPAWLASTAATGTSGLFDAFCVASEGYRNLFIGKGVDPSRIFVTGIPNFDDCERYQRNDFPHRHYVLVCTSDSRETWAFEDRKRFIRRAVRIAAGRQVIFKLHPNENVRRATREIQRHAPGALVYSSGSAEEMIANCDVLITRYSSTAYVGLALGKEVHSAFDIEQLRCLLPLQNRSSARNIARVCTALLEGRVLHAAPSRHVTSRLMDDSPLLEPGSNSATPT